MFFNTRVALKICLFGLLVIMTFANLMTTNLSWDLLGKTTMLAFAIAALALTIRDNSDLKRGRALREAEFMLNQKLEEQGLPPYYASVLKHLVDEFGTERTATAIGQHGWDVTILETVLKPSAAKA